MSCVTQTRFNCRFYWVDIGFGDALSRMQDFLFFFMKDSLIALRSNFCVQPPGYDTKNLIN